MSQYRGNGGIHAAGKGAENFFPGHLFSQRGDAFFGEGAHLPVAGAFTDIIEETAEHFFTEGRMFHFGVELHAEELFFRVHDRRVGAGARVSDGDKARRQSSYLIGVTHPAAVIFFHIVKEWGVFKGDLGSSVFSFVGADNFAAQNPAHALKTVADAENGNAQFKNILGRKRRSVFIGIVRTAGENNTFGIQFSDLLGIGMPRE